MTLVRLMSSRGGRIAIELPSYSESRSTLRTYGGVDPLDAELAALDAIRLSIN
jgi:hypothetical protein